MKYPALFCTLLAFVILFLSHQTLPQTHIPSGIVNGKWLKQNSPYFIDGEIKIPRGKKLIIEPGVKVIFTGHHKLIVNGILEARGTKQDSINFVPSDTAVGWHGIRFIESEDFSHLEYCVLRNGKSLIGADKIIEECSSDPNCDEMDFDGGAMLLNKSNPFISNCLFTDNLARVNGGGIAIENNSNPRIRNCQFQNNSGQGSGIYCSNHSNPVLSNCIITGNRGRNLSGGITVQDYCNPIIDSCIIKNNTGEYRGGGICFYTSSKPVVKNSMIYNNTATLGGGIYIDEFYNVFREQPGKIDIQITNTRIENNLAEYGGGIWLRDAMGKFNGVSVCNNTASVAGGGIHIEHNPFLFKFSSENSCNIFMNFARMLGNDLFRLGGGVPMEVPLDTFTVKYYSELNAEPIDKWVLGIKNYKLTQVNADLYVSPDGDDSNSGLSSDDALKTLRIALTRILADSLNPHSVFMKKGEYIFTETNDILLLDKHKYVSVKGTGFTEVIFSTDRITVFTPWWISTWALVIYSSVVIAIIIMMVNVRTRRFKVKAELEKKEFEAKKLHEVDELKTRFFTNISHEFRTPLTLILGPAKRILERSNDIDSKADADFIHRSAKKLNRLVDELLDISKIESGEMKIKTCRVNLIPIVKELAFSFSSLADRKKITFKVSNNHEEIVIYIDKDKFDKILSNVLANAFKFTPEKGKVEIEITRNERFAEINVSDTGTGIPENQIDKIFDRFYQVDGSHTRRHEGTGIGLALTKELIELHSGKIGVESEEGKGSKFKLIFPLGKDHLKPEEICEEEADQYIQKENLFPELEETAENLYDNDAISESSDKPVLLIVEDNPDVRKYIRMTLGNVYNICEAKDGDEGLEKSFESIPDLIISDIMMPKLDGFTMCKKLKTDTRTSHIPIIILTAKATMNDKLNGLEIGADDYIMKPFEAEELKARIKNLLEQRQRLHEHFRRYGLVDIEDKKITSVDRKFIQQAVEIINKNISDTLFGVEKFAEDMAISKSLLFKKTSSLIGIPPIELIKRTRLNKAAKLIENNSGNISEIALEVGFNNPSYFTECFKKQFGVIPSQYHLKSSNT